LIDPVLRVNTERFQLGPTALLFQAEQWNGHDRDPDYLLSGRALKEAVASAAGRQASEIAPLEQEYLAASEAHRDRQLARRRRIVVSLVAAVILLICLIGWLLWKLAQSGVEIACDSLLEFLGVDCGATPTASDARATEVLERTAAQAMAATRAAEAIEPHGSAVVERIRADRETEVARTFSLAASVPRAHEVRKDELGALPAR
jgi:hypothetical protein